MGGPGSLQVARVFGIPIFVHFSWVLVFALIAWTLATDYFPDRYPELAVTSLLGARPGGVAAVLRVRPAPRARPFAGRHPQRDRHRVDHAVHLRRAWRGWPASRGTGGTEFRIAAAGPAGQRRCWPRSSPAVAYSGVFGGASGAVARYLAMVNVVVAVFNLVPAFPARRRPAAARRPLAAPRQAAGHADGRGRGHLLRVLPDPERRDQPAARAPR